MGEIAGSILRDLVRQRRPRSALGVAKLSGRCRRALTRGFRPCLDVAPRRKRRRASGSLASRDLASAIEPAIDFRNWP